MEEHRLVAVESLGAAEMADLEPVVRLDLDTRHALGLAISDP